MLGFHRDSKDQSKADRASAPAALQPDSAGAPSGQGASKRLGEILIEEGLINDLALDEALAEQRKTGGFIGEILVAKGFAKQSDILHSLVKQCKIPHLSLLDYDINKDLLPLIPKEICFKYNLLPIDKLGRILTVAMVNPLDDEALAEVRKHCPDLRIKAILCDWQHFDSVASRIFNEERKGKSGSYDHLMGPAPGSSKPPQSQPAAQETAPPAAEDDVAMQAALNAAVTKVIESAEAAEPQAEATIQAKTAAHSQTPAAPTPDLVASLRSGLAGALQDALGPIVSQLGAASAHGSAPDAGHIGDAVRDAVRDVLRENEAVAVARSNRLDLEMRDRENAKRLRHGAESPLAANKRRGMEVVQTPESREEADRRVAAGLSSDRLLEEYTFDRFLVGAANAFTYKICRAAAEHPGGDYNPLFIYGEVGLGKTHLIHAAGNAIVTANPDARVGCVSASRFASRLLEAQSEGAIKIFRDNYCHWDVLILDDIQFLGGRVDAQEEFFHIFNVLQQEERQIIIAGDKPPDRLGMLENRLVSRFAGGIVVNLKPPELDTRLEILRRAAESGTAVDEDILAMVATRVPTDIRKMLGALRKILAFADLEKKPVSLEVAGEILNHLGINEAA